jgi:hypothetical protein
MKFNPNAIKLFTPPCSFCPKGGSHSKATHRPSSRLGSSFCRCAPAATNPEVYAKHNAACGAVCRHRHSSHWQSSITTTHYVIPWFPVWSPYCMQRGSIRGWVFYYCDPPVPEATMILCEKVGNVIPATGLGLSISISDPTLVYKTKDCRWNLP